MHPNTIWIRERRASPDLSATGARRVVPLFKADIVISAGLAIPNAAHSAA